MPVIPQVTGELRSHVGATQGVGDSGIARLQGEAVERLGEQLGRLGRELKEGWRQKSSLNAKSAAALYEHKISQEVTQLDLLGPTAYIGDDIKNATPAEKEDLPAFATEVFRRRGEKIASEISKQQFAHDDLAHNMYITQVNDMFGSKYSPKAQLAIASGFKSEGLVALENSINSRMFTIRENPDAFEETLEDLTNTILGSRFLSPEQKLEKIRNLPKAGIDSLVSGFEARRDYQGARQFLAGAQGKFMHPAAAAAAFDKLEQAEWNFETRTHTRSERERIANERIRKARSKEHLMSTLESLSIYSTEMERNEALHKLTTLHAKGEVTTEDYNIGFAASETKIQKAADDRHIFKVVDKFHLSGRTSKAYKEAVDEIHRLARPINEFGHIIDPASVAGALQRLKEARGTKERYTKELQYVQSVIIQSGSPRSMHEQIMQRLNMGEMPVGMLSPAAHIQMQRVIDIWREGGNPMRYINDVLRQLDNPNSVTPAARIRYGGRERDNLEAFVKSVVDDPTIPKKAKDELIIEAHRVKKQEELEQQRKGRLDEELNKQDPAPAAGERRKRKK